MVPVSDSLHSLMHNLETAAVPLDYRAYNYFMSLSYGNYIIVFNILQNAYLYLFCLQNTVCTMNSF